MSNHHKQLVRKCSWWKSAGTPVRTFVIAELRSDLSPEGEVYFTSVGLLEYGYDGPDYILYYDFLKMVEEGKVIPLNTLPNYKSATQHPP